MISEPPVDGPNNSGGLIFFLDTPQGLILVHMHFRTTAMHKPKGNLSICNLGGY